jgi:RimJ/RimL family protein N-acetyltransferase
MLLRFDSSRRSTLEQTRAAIRRWIDARDAGGPMFAYALRLPSRLLTGGCEIRLLPPDRAKVSHWIFPEFPDRGYATRALALLCENAARIQGIEQLEARIDTDNIASRQVAEKDGIYRDGHRGRCVLGRNDLLTYPLFAARHPRPRGSGLGLNRGLKSNDPRTAFSVAFELATVGPRDYPCEICG